MMNGISQRISDLSPEQRMLLNLRLKKLQPVAGARPITKRPEPGPCALTVEQERLWLVQQIFPESAAYNISNGLRFHNCPDVAALAKSLDRLVQRHEILRTAFFALDGEPAQEALPATPMPLPLIDLSHMGAVRDMEPVIGSLVRRPFDLRSGRPLRAALLRLDQDEHVLLVTLHHIVTDWWSFEIFWREIMALYDAFSQGLSDPLAPLPIQFSDFAAWQRNWLRNEVLERHLEYWRNQLEGIPTLLALPTDRPRPKAASFRGRREWFRLDTQVSDALKEISRSLETTTFAVLLALFATLLNRYTGNEDVLVGTPVADRPQPVTEKLIGYFLNMLVLRVDLSRSPSFKQLVQRVRQTVLGAYEHQHLPLGKLLEELRLERSLGHSALFQVALIYLATPERARASADKSDSGRDYDPGTARFDLTLVVEDQPKGFLCFLEYSSALFENATVARMAGHLRTLAEMATSGPDGPLADLELLTAEERAQLLVQWNDTETSDPWDCCVHDLIHHQTVRSPDSVALTYNEEALTYGELDRRARRLACRLGHYGVGPESRVALAVERSPLMVIGLLGILKAGAAYVPIDPEYPNSRQSHMVESSGATVLLSEESVLRRSPRCCVHVICLDHDWPGLSGERAEGPGTCSNSSSLAYVLYTSGSTGNPKGVQVSHRALVNLLRSLRKDLGLTVYDYWVAVTSLSFDIAGLELLLPLVTGVGIELVDRSVAGDPARLVGPLRRASVFQATPATWRMLVDAGWTGGRDLKALCGGEALSGRLAHALIERTGTAWNLYGPTETTIYSTMHRLDAGSGRSTNGPPPIGRSISGTLAFVLDARLHPVPVGIPGELCISGTGVARGYLGQPDLTAERFIPNPYSQQPGDRLYRTGDVVRWIPDGSLDFLGRNDLQVKVRGFRIELGEIEAILVRHPGVREAIVELRVSQEEERLIGYFVPACNQAPTAGELRQFLRGALPEFMVPSTYVPLAAMPLAANRKTDRRSLPTPDRELDLEEGVGPRTLIEELLINLWRDLLKARAIKPTESFFDLGGHSLLATRLISQIKRVFGLDLPLRFLFESPTLERMALGIEAALQEGKSVNIPAIQRLPRDGDLPLSSAQRRLWFLDQLEPGSSTFNMPRAVRLSGIFNPAVLEHSLTEIRRRHEVLRTSFMAVDDEPRQVIAPAEDVHLPIVDLSGLTPGDREAEAHRLAREEAERPFDLARGPLLRAGLLWLDSYEGVLLLTLHHIVVDGWSMGLLMRELSLLCRAFSERKPSPLPELLIQYADFAQWQSVLLKDEDLESALSYWRGRLAGLPELKLPFEQPQPVLPSRRGEHHSFTLSTRLTQQLKQVSREEQATVFMTALAAFQVLLYSYTGQTDIVVGTTIANRGRVEIDSLIGLFVNLLAIRSDLSGRPAFRDLVHKVRETVLEAYAYQHLPFERVVEELLPLRRGGQSPLLRALLAFQVPQAAVEVPGLTFSSFPVEHPVSRFDISLFLQESGERLEGTWVFRTDCFDRDALVGMFTRFETLLASIVRTPDARLDELDILTEKEQSARAAELEKREKRGFETFRRIRHRSVSLPEGEE